MKTESRILADTRIQKLEPFLNGYRGFLQLRCGKQRAFTFCATRDIPEDGSTGVGNLKNVLHLWRPANGWKW